MDFSEMERAVYGRNLEEDEELMAELLALQQEEEAKQKQSNPSKPSSKAAPPRAMQPLGGALAGVDPAILASALAEDVHVDEQALENDPELLAELSGLIGGSEDGTPSALEAAPPPPLPKETPPSGMQNTALLCRLRELLGIYEKMFAASVSESNAAKQRRYKRSVDKLKELIAKVELGENIEESEIPPAPPSLSSTTPSAKPPPSTPSAAVPPVPQRRSSGFDANLSAEPPPLPKRTTSSFPAESPVKGGESKKHQIFLILKRRRDKYVANGKAAVAAMDKTAAKQYVETAKMFDQALAALDTASVDELDMAEIPPSPPPYRRSVAEDKPTTFIGGLQNRMERFQQIARKATEDGNERKARMNKRMANQYAAAIEDAKAGRPVAVADLPSLPDMPPLPPQKMAAPSGPAPGMKPPPDVGPLAPSGQPGKSRNQTQLEFLITRQNEFRHAAMQAKARGNIELAKKYLLESKGFDKMITAAKAGLPVSIKSTPIPPQVSTSQATLQPRIVPAASSTTGIEDRGEALSMMEKALIEQVQLAENSRMRFTRLGDVGKVKMFEDWAKASKQDLLLVREVAKQGLRLPKFHYETRHIPSADLFPDLAEDVMELSIVRCRDVPLPSGYEPSDANLYVKFVFPYPTDGNQSGKTKHVSGTQNPEFDELAVLQIGPRKTRGHRLLRVLKRMPLKLEIYQKGGFLRSDKLLGTCEWKLDQLESNALLEESLPLKEGRKAIGGLLTVKIRVREPLGDAKVASIQHRWLILDN